MRCLGICVSFSARASIKRKTRPAWQVGSRIEAIWISVPLRDKFPYQFRHLELSKLLNWFARFEVGQLAARKKKKKKSSRLAIKLCANRSAEAQLQLTRATNFAAAAATAAIWRWRWWSLIRGWQFAPFVCYSSSRVTTTAGREERYYRRATMRTKIIAVFVPITPCACSL